MSSTVPSADAKAVVKAVEGLSAQVRRVADALSTPVVEYAVRADDDATTPVEEDQALRWARRESLLVLLTRLQRGRALTEAEAGTLRHHIETEIREADTARRENEQLLGEQAACIAAEQRADVAERELRVLRAGLRAAGGDPTQIQNLWAQIRLRNRQWREAKGERDQAQAAIERVRAIKRAPQRSEFNTLANAQDNGWDAALHEVQRALDGTEQPTTGCVPGPYDDCPNCPHDTAEQPTTEGS